MAQRPSDRDGLPCKSRTSQLVHNVSGFWTSLTWFGFRLKPILLLPQMPQTILRYSLLKGSLTKVQTKSSVVLFVVWLFRLVIFVSIPLISFDYNFVTMLEHQD